ncbi:MAG: class I SAM-dependent methyltransferase, partial [Anaerolineae bacterium]
MDFGCGPGRTLIHFRDAASSSRFYGTDIDSEAITWCQQNLTQVAQWRTNKAEPPTEYDDDSFDLIYAISVFTHLDEPLQLAWLAELKRILKPGGLLIGTVHGSFYSHDNFSPEQKACMDEKGFLYTVGSRGTLKLDGLPDFYQTAFHTKAYIFHEWSKFFRIVKYV